MVCWIINQSTGIYRSEPPCEGSLHQAFRCCCHRSSRGRNVIGRKLAAKHGDGLCAFREDCALHRELPLWRGIPVSNYLAFYFSCLCRNFVLRLLGKVGVNSRPCATYPHPPLLSPIARWIPDEFGQKKGRRSMGGESSTCGIDRVPFYFIWRMGGNTAAFRERYGWYLGVHLGITR